MSTRIDKYNPNYSPNKKDDLPYLELIVFVVMAIAFYILLS